MSSTSSNFNLRGISPEVMSLLKSKAKEEHSSVNVLILKYIDQGIGKTRKKRIAYDDLDHLAGTWSKQDFEEFKKNTKCFEEVDRDLWT
jgi:hypothetical protein